MRFSGRERKPNLKSNTRSTGGVGVIITTTIITVIGAGGVGIITTTTIGTTIITTTGTITIITITGETLGGLEDRTRRFYSLAPSALRAAPRMRR